MHTLAGLCYTKVVFNELEARCLPLTAAAEQLVNKIALLSSTGIALAGLRPAMSFRERNLREIASHRRHWC